ncbi:MAG: hypothetical protein LBJ20_01680 [Candidatus Methanoplasma sp.]|jgi:hypothetical protein|nr:hypothetical protein [Candidatus Methanoplasma sp.]
MEKNSKIITLILILCMVSAVAAPVIGSFGPSSDSATDDAYDSIPLAAGPPDFAGYVVGYIMGFSAGFIPGFVYGMIAGSPDAGGGDQDAVDGAMRTSEANKVIFAMDTAKNLISTVLPADAEMWPFSATYFERSAEYSVAEYWTLDAEYDAIYSLDETYLMPNASNYLYSWSSAIENAYNSPSYYVGQWNSAAAYSSMGYSLLWDGGGLSGGATPTTTINMDILQVASPTSGHNRVYIDNTGPLGDTPAIDHSFFGKMYVFGSGATVNIINVETGIEYRLNKGSNDLSSVYNASTQVTGPLPSGFYDLAVGSAYAGSMLQVDSAHTAQVVGGMVASQGTSLYYITANGADHVRIYNSLGSLVANSASLRYSVTYADQNKNSIVANSYLLQNVGGTITNIIGNYNDLIRSINGVVDRTCNAAEAIWGIFDITEESSMWISPSSITTNIPGYTMSVPEIQAVYVQAMKQIYTYYQNNITELDDYEFVTNVESIGLYCYGDVYVNGKLWIEDAVFTPYITTSEQSLKIGMNEWGGSGFAMIWAQVDNYSDWNGQTNLAANMPVDLSSGYDLDIKKIVSKGQNVQSIDLSLYKVKKHNSGGGDGDKTPTDVPKVLDAKLLITVIILQIALELALIWWKFPISWILLLLAGIVACVGLFASGWIAGILL